MSLLYSKDNSSKSTTKMKRSSQQKRKPIDINSNTWSSCSSSSITSTYCNEQQQQQKSTLTIMSTYDRIHMYEQKYQQCMDSRTELSNWIRTVKSKGLPTPLMEGYTPPPHVSASTATNTRSRLPDLFSSLSTRPRHHQHLLDTPITTKSSLSTFLKKATESISIPPSLKRSTNSGTTNQQQQRFSLTSSLNRFSLPKNSSYSSMTEKYYSVNSNSDVNQKKSNKKSRFSTPPPLPSNHYNQYQNQRKQQYNISPPELIKSSNNNAFTIAHNNNRNDQLLSQKKKKIRPQSSILPHSPSSIFLDRLRSSSRSTCYDVLEGKECQLIQPNNITLTASNQQVYYPHIYTIVDNYNNNNSAIEDLTPPSSPSSTNSTNTPSLISNSRKCSQDSQSQASSSGSSGNNSIIATPANINNTLPKKKRTSLLVSPSLSTIRLISQKSQFLKRQSMSA